MSDENYRDPTIIPTPDHPLFQHYAKSRSWKKGMLARKALLRHVRADSDTVIHLSTMLATLDIAAMSNETEWKKMLGDFAYKFGQPALNQLVTACQQWIMLCYDTPDDYLADIDDFIKMFVIQMAPNSILPNQLTKDFKQEEMKGMLSTNPIVMFLIAIFLGGPLSEMEVKQLFKQPKPKGNDGLE